MHSITSLGGGKISFNSSVRVVAPDDSISTIPLRSDDGFFEALTEEYPDDLDASLDLEGEDAFFDTQDGLADEGDPFFR